MAERSLHRERVRVVAVVDEQPSSRQRLLFLAPAGERDAHGAALGLFERQPERAVGGERRERVRRVVARTEAELDLGLPAEGLHGQPRVLVGLEGEQLHVPARPVPDEVDVRAAEVRLEQRLVGGHGSDASGR